MDKLSNLLRSHPSSEPFSEEDFIRRVNAQQGKDMREGYDCPLCLNKEFRMVIENGDRIHRSCKCFWIRQRLARLRKRGLLDLYKQCTFARFTTDEEWQAHAKAKAVAYKNSDLHQWFFISGQSGCGKTHLCTAIAGKLILDGHDVQVFRWVEFAAKAKSVIGDSEGYRNLVQPLKDCEVLYLDDFLKVQHGQAPTPADIRLAFEILDARYNDPRKTVILSSEFFLDKILTFDEALAGRIAERSGNFLVQIQNAAGRNYRFKQT